MIFGSTGDSSVLLKMGRELLRDVVEQEILFYKVNEALINDNIYGESLDKAYYTPIRFTCRIKRGEPTWTSKEYGSDVDRTTSFAFFKDDIVEANCMLEVGDIIEWDKNYYEIDSTVENQYLLGKDPWYRLDSSRTNKFGMSVSIVCNTHQTRIDKLNLIDR